MNDRFKFRVWNGSEMHHNDFVVTATGYVGKITEEFLGQCVFKQDDLSADKECILMQSTGLKDKNGKLIYEGDIIVIPNEYPFYDEGALNYIGIVENIYNSWQYVYHYVNPLKNGISERINYLLNEFGFKENENSLFKVIGNIYENKELLE